MEMNIAFLKIIILIILFPYLDRDVYREVDSEIFYLFVIKIEY